MKKHNDHRSLEQNFSLILKKSKEGPLTLHTIFKILSGKGKPLILIFLSLPFCVPIHIPGLSTPFGLVIMFIALRIAFGKRVWLPQMILKRKVSSHFLKKVIDKSTWVLIRLKRIVHPRFSWVCDHPLSHRIHGLCLAALGFFLSLPLPIPLTNLMAAWPILLVSIGLLEEDGLMIFIGYAIFILFFLGSYFLIISGFRYT